MPRKPSRLVPPAPPAVKSRPQLGVPESALIAQEEGQDHALRVPFLKEWQTKTGRFPVTYFANFSDPNASLDDTDVDMIEDLINHAPGDAKLDLIVESPGGSALSAERLVKTCRAFSTDFRVVVPRRAKSAATMVAMGANSILMGPAAELGPVDPQVFYFDQYDNFRVASVDSVLKGVDEVLEKFQKARGNVEGLLMLLPPFDQATLAEMRRDSKLSEELAVRWCSEMPKHRSKKIAQVRKAIQIFLDPAQTHSHGRPIDFKAAEESGLPVTQLRRDSDLWRTLHRVCIRTARHVHRFAKSVETIEMAFYVPRTRQPS